MTKHTSNNILLYVHVLAKLCCLTAASDDLEDYDCDACFLRKQACKYSIGNGHGPPHQGCGIAKQPHDKATFKSGSGAGVACGAGSIRTATFLWKAVLSSHLCERKYGSLSFQVVETLITYVIRLILITTFMYRLATFTRHMVKYSWASAVNLVVRPLILMREWDEIDILMMGMHPGYGRYRNLPQQSHLEAPGEATIWSRDLGVRARMTELPEVRRAGTIVTQLDGQAREKAATGSQSDVRFPASTYAPDEEIQIEATTRTAHMLLAKSLPPYGDRVVIPLLEYARVHWFAIGFMELVPAHRVVYIHRI